MTQRGNHKENVFFSDANKNYYLKLLQQYALKHQVKILAYCLMTNNVHLIFQPATKEGLQKSIKTCAYAL
ncbi:transposase [Abyssogena phaseoliformis symbiont]|uniref:transposase n=1 Tax=Abyssogena phaseoliformis symbiont TaxID=596095 RepID=UPI003CC94990